jgi:N-methylhydantoinase A
MRLRVGIDIGGTFTDVVALDDDTSRMWQVKVPSDPVQPTANLVRTLQRLRDLTGATRGEITTVTLGHTIALNALLERRGSRTALLTTAGFRDVLAIGRESRTKLFDLQQDPRPLLVPRHLRYEIDERMDATGSVLRPVRAEDVERIADAMVGEDVESVAVCLLHAYANPTHERAIGELLRGRFEVCLSHEVLSEHREYERTVLTVLNAYVVPKVAEFLGELQGALADSDPQASLYITDSAGGTMAAGVARRRAIHSAFSGPASGVRAAAVVGAAANADNLLTLDIGGTSCDVGVVRDGEVGLTHRSVLGGFPIGLSSVDVVSVGAGGGSVAWVDDGGLLRVGPRSSGAVPGPACYGRGGSEPTVTDAHLVLGHLDPNRILGSDLQLRRDLAVEAIERKVADALGMTVEEAAAGIITIADAELVRALEGISIGRGEDPRESTLIAFGGAGPLHCGAIASAVGISRVVIPSDAGVLCAHGALAAEERYEFSQSWARARGAEAGDGLTKLRKMAAELRLRAAALVPDIEDGFVEDHVLQIRYVGQTSTLAVPVNLDADDVLEDAHKQFEVAYHEVFGYAMPRPTEVEALRLVVHRPRGAIPLQSATASEQPRAGKPWRAHFGSSGFLDATLYDRSELAALMPVRGPAVITADSSTTVVMPGHTARLDPMGNLVIHINKDSETTQ